MSCLHGLYEGAFHRKYSSSCDNLPLRHAVKIRSKLCPLAKYGILASSSRCGDCMTNNLFIIKATFPCLGISANMLLQAPSAHLEHSFIDFDCRDEPWINTTAITTCPYIFSEKNPILFELAAIHNCILSLYWHSIHVCCVEFAYFELLSISAVDYSDWLLSFCNN